jgi:hypothetical protein
VYRILPSDRGFEQIRSGYVDRLVAVNDVNAHLDAEQAKSAVISQPRDE